MLALFNQQGLSRCSSDVARGLSARKLQTHTLNKWHEAGMGRSCPCTELALHLRGGGARRWAWKALCESAQSTVLEDIQ